MAFDRGDGSTGTGAASVLPIASGGTGADNAADALNNLVPNGAITAAKLESNITIPFADGTAAAPSITNTGDTNTGVFFPADNAVGISTNGTEKVRVTSTGNVGIGVNNPGSYDTYANALVVKGGTTDSGITIQNKAGTKTGYAQINFAYGTSGSQAYQSIIGCDFQYDLLYFAPGADVSGGSATFMMLGSGGLSTKIENGTSTRYPAYMARAWVNFNGTGTVAIRASGNVSSITDNGTGDYYVNFITAMPDTNYSVLNQGWSQSNQYAAWDTVSRCIFLSYNDAGSPTDEQIAQIAIFR